MDKVQFDIIGYTLDYYVDGKYMGNINTNKRDRDTLSWFGRTTTTLECDVVLNNKKRVKKGTIVTTELNPLCGKVLKH